MAKANVHLVVTNVLRCACWAGTHGPLSPRGRALWWGFLNAAAVCLTPQTCMSLWLETSLQCPPR